MALPKIPPVITLDPLSETAAALAWDASAMVDARVDIAAADICEYHGDAVPVKARLYANRSFKAADWTLVQCGSQEYPDFYQEFDLSYDGRWVRIEAGKAFSTTDSDQPDASYDLDAYDQEGTFLFHILAHIRIVPVSPTTWSSIKEGSKSVQLRYPPTYMDTEAIMRMVSQLTNAANKANATMIGTSKLDVDPDDLANPIAVGVNSPLLDQLGELAAASVYGRTRLDVEPVDPLDPVAVGANSPLIARHLNGYANLTAAIAAGPGIIPITQPMTVSADTTTPATNMLVISGAGSITVAAGKTLTIGSMLSPGTRKIFTLADAASHVLFAPAAVEQMNIAWFAGNAGGDATRAINECLGSTYPNGGYILIPNKGWTTAGGHVLTVRTTIRGLAGNPDGTFGTTLMLSSAAAGFMFKINEAFRELSFEDITLDAGAFGVPVLWGENLGALGDSGYGLDVRRVTFRGNAVAPQVLFSSPFATSALISSVKFDHCKWMVPANGTAVKIDDQNFDAVFIQPSFLMQAGAIGFDIVAATQISLIAPSFGGPGSWSAIEAVNRTIAQASITTGTNVLSLASDTFTPYDIGQRVVIAGKLDSYITELTDQGHALVHDNATATATNESLDVYRLTGPDPRMAKACIRTSAGHGTINILGSQDEGVGHFLLAEGGSQRSPVIHIQSSTIQSYIKCTAEGGMTISSIGNWYWAGTFISEFPGFMVVSSIGDYCQKATLGFGRMLSIGRLEGPSTYGCLIEEGGFPAGLGSPAGTTYIPQEFKSTTHLSSPDNMPMVTIAHGQFFDKPFLRLGTLDQAEKNLFWYDLRNIPSTGHLQFSGNQVGYAGYDFVAQDAQAFMIEGHGTVATAVLNHKTTGNPNCGFVLQHNDTGYWLMGAFSTHADTHAFAIYNLHTGAEALLFYSADNTAEFTGNVLLDPGKKLTVGGDATTPGFNLRPQAADPAAPNEGDIWFNSTTHKFRGRANGVNVDLS